MKKLIAYLKACTSHPRKNYAAIEPQLSTLQSELEGIQKMPNKVEAIVRLFQVTSPLQDAEAFNQSIFQLREKNYGQLDAAIAAIKTLRAHIGAAGRDKYGMNRTEAGEEVTAATVFLGNVFGIWTFSASHFLEHKERLDAQPVHGAWHYKENREASVWECINDHQAGIFVRRHVEGMLEQISILQKAFTH